MDKARIINKDYSVITYKVNGRVRRIVEPTKKKSSKYDKVVFNAIHETQSHDWATVSNFLDDYIQMVNDTTNIGHKNKLAEAISRNTL